MKKWLAVAALLFGFGSAKAQLFSVTGGIHTNAVRDSLQYVFIMMSTDAKIDTTVDSVVFLRFRVDGTDAMSFVDRVQTTIDTFNLANYAGDVGAFRKVVRSSAGTTGSYLVRAIAYKAGSSLRQQLVASYTVFDSCPRTWTGTPCPIFAGRNTDTITTVLGNVNGNVAGSVGSVTGAVGSVTNEVRVVSAETTTTLLGNVNGNVAGSVGSVTGAVGSVTNEVRVVSAETTTTLLGNVNGNVAGSVNSVTSPVTVGTNNDKTGYTLTAAGIQAIRDTLRKLVYNSLELNMIPNGDFEADDSTAATQTPTGWTVSAGAATLVGAAGNVKPWHGKYCVTPNGGLMQTDSFWLTPGMFYYFGARVLLDTTTYSIAPILRVSRTAGGGFQLVNATNITNKYPTTGGASVRRWVLFDTVFTVASSGFHYVNVTGDGAAGDSSWFDNLVLLPFPAKDSAAIAALQDTSHAIHVETDALNGASLANLDAAVSSRMATYIQPSGFLATTFPTQVASRDSLTLRPVKTDFASMTIGTAANVTTVNGLSAAALKSIGDENLFRLQGIVAVGSTAGKIISTAAPFNSITDDEIANSMIVFSPNVGAGNRRHVSYITRFWNTGDSMQIRPILPVAPTAGDTFTVIGIMGKTVSTDSTQALNATATVDTAALMNTMYNRGFARIRYLRAGQTGVASNDTVNTSSSGGGGTFGTTYTDTIYTRNTSTSSQIPNVIVTVKNSSGTDLGKFNTSVNGKFVTTFDAGTYYLYPNFTSGISWTDNPDTFVVTGNGQNDTIRGATFDPGTPADPSQCIVWQNVTGKNGRWAVGAKVVFTLQTDTAKIDSALIGGKVFEGYTDTMGYFGVPVLINSRITPAGSYYDFTVTANGGYGEVLISRSRIIVPNQCCWRLTY